MRHDRLHCFHLDAVRQTDVGQDDVERFRIDPCQRLLQPFDPGHQKFARRIFGQRSLFEPRIALVIFKQQQPDHFCVPTGLHSFGNVTTLTQNSSICLTTFMN